MNVIQLSPKQVLQAYDEVATLYPTVPSLTMWRAWELAAYREFRLIEPVLDIGCGDGRFFRLAWPKIRDVVGVDADAAVVALAKASGVYRQVTQAPADAANLPEAGFGSAFANCSLEHMDNLDAVLGNIARALPRGAPFLLSVCTREYAEWNTFAGIVRIAGFPKVAESIEKGFIDFHHFVNPLTLEQWCDRVAAAGFSVDTAMPVLPEVTGRVFLAIDTAWHVRMEDGKEFGEHMYARFQRLPRFAENFRRVLEGLLHMEDQPTKAIGAVLHATRA
jgi:SAM-dependent methyltransferase